MKPEVRIDYAVSGGALCRAPVNDGGGQFGGCNGKIPNCLPARRRGQ